MIQIGTAVDRVPPKATESKYGDDYHKIASEVAKLPFRNGDSPAIPLGPFETVEEAYAVALALRNINKQRNGNVKFSVRPEMKRVYASRAS